MTIKLYYTISSPPSRAVILTLRALNISYELQNFNLFEHEHLSEEFKKLNPQCTVPTIEDDGFVIWESHAINAYLINKYGKDDKLYPKEPKIRAIVDQRLHFDTGVLFAPLRYLSRQIIFNKAVITEVPQEITDEIEDAFGLVEEFLKDKKYIAGDDITIADFSVLPTINNLSILVPLNTEKFPLLAEYLQRCEVTIPSLKELMADGSQEVRNILSKINFAVPQ